MKGLFCDYCYVILLVQTMKKTILLILVILSIFALTLRFGRPTLDSFLQITEKAGIRVLSVPDGAQMFIDEAEVGKTPYENTQLENKQYLVKIQSGEAIWQGKVTLNGGTLTVVNRDLSKETTSSAGEILTLEKGQGVIIISSPVDGDIEIDGKFYGKTPKLVEIDAGEHTFVISHGNYLKRSIRAYVPEGFNLTLSVDLALSEADLTAITTPVILKTQMVVVKDTVSPNPGFLRVRDKPSTAGKELARVLPGEELVLLEELSGWDRIRLSNGTEGYVSKTYVDKKTS